MKSKQMKSKQMKRDGLLKSEGVEDEEGWMAEEMMRNASGRRRRAIDRY